MFAVLFSKLFSRCYCLNLSTLPFKKINKRQRKWKRLFLGNTVSISFFTCNTTKTQWWILPSLMVLSLTIIIYNCFIIIIIIINTFQRYRWTEIFFFYSFNCISIRQSYCTADCVQTFLPVQKIMYCTSNARFSNYNNNNAFDIMNINPKEEGVAAELTLCDWQGTPWSDKCLAVKMGRKIGKQNEDSWGLPLWIPALYPPNLKLRRQAHYTVCSNKTKKVSCCHLSHWEY